MADVAMAEPAPDERRASPPSAWTAVNGRHSPPDDAMDARRAADPPRPLATARRAHLTTRTGDAPQPQPLGIPPTHSAETVLTTSPSLVESTPTTGRHESPPSPTSVPSDGEPRKRSFDGAFAGEREAAAAMARAAQSAQLHQQRAQQQQSPLRTLPPLHAGRRDSASPDRSPRADARRAPPGPANPKTTGAQRPMESDYDPLAGSYPAPASSGTGDRPDDDDDPLDSDDDDDGADDSYASPSRDGSRAFSRTASGVQVDPERTKRRKRVFSNRTKTGCLTCRKRKKKCDEAHPECNNCLRGGFVCEGYSVRNPWQKPSQAKAPVLQSKPSGFPAPAPPSGPSTPQHAAPRFPSELQAMEDRPRPAPRGDPPPPRQWGPPPSHAVPPHPYPPAPHVSPHQHYREPPPGHESPMYPPAGGLPLHPGHAPHPNTLPALGGPPVLEDPRRPATAPGARELTERERMLRGEYYLPYTPALMADREQCALAVGQFNNAANPATGFRFEDRQRMFAHIVGLRPTPDPHGPAPGAREPPPDPQFVPNGGVGPGTVVEAPFGCDYGYNISVGRDCVIGADTRINDACSVTIGDHVVFSRGVRLITGTYAIDPKERKKGKGRTLGRSIVIEDDAWLGPECTILPGVRVGRGSTIGAGSLVHKDVPPFTVMAGNPPKVIRGIYEEISTAPRSG